jgi:hypothetical protein
MAKYDPLREYLKRQTKTKIPLDFKEIEDILGSKLPPSARKHSAWWARGQAGQHVQKRAWLDAGFVVDNFDIIRERVEFTRDRV